MNHVTVNQLAALDAPVVIDVREADEYASGHVPGARNLHLSQLEDHLGDVPTGTPVHIICQSGGRSARATATLTAHGYDAVNVEGGTSAWIAAGNPVDRA